MTHPACTDRTGQLPGGPIMRVCAMVLLVLRAGSHGPKQAGPKAPPSRGAEQQERRPHCVKLFSSKQKLTTYDCKSDRTFRPVFSIRRIQKYSFPNKRLRQYLYLRKNMAYGSLRVLPLFCQNSQSASRLWYYLSTIKRQNGCILARGRTSGT